MSENFLTAKINITLVSAAHCRFHLHKTKLLLERERRFCAAGLVAERLTKSGAKMIELVHKITLPRRK